MCMCVCVCVCVFVCVCACVCMCVCVCVYHLVSNVHSPHARHKGANVLERPCIEFLHKVAEVLVRHARGDVFPLRTQAGARDGLE
jgi:hypothetical protein